MERIGDLVLTTPVFKTIKKTFTNASVSIVVNSYTKDIVKENPHLDNIFVYDALNTQRTLFGKWQFVSSLRSKNFDLAIDLTTRDFYFLPELLAFLSKARITVGLNNLSRGFLFHNKVKQFRDSR